MLGARIYYICAASDGCPLLEGICRVLRESQRTFLFPSVKAKVQNHSVFTNICTVSYAWIPSSYPCNQPLCILPHVETDSYSLERPSTYFQSLIASINVIYSQLGTSVGNKLSKQCKNTRCRKGSDLW